MAKTGVVHAINRQRGMVALDTDDGYTIIELLSDDNIDIGDVMWWKNDTGLGGETYHNLTKGVQMNIYAQNHWVHETLLRKQLLLE